jgi:hypothetical protein
MNTTQATCRIEGYSPAGRMTAKAVRVTLTSVDGEDARVDTAWLPRSICSGLQIEKVSDPYEGDYVRVRATVPAWWVRKLESERAASIDWNRPIPLAQKPW